MNEKPSNIATIFETEASNPLFNIIFVFLILIIAVGGYFFLVLALLLFIGLFFQLQKHTQVEYVETLPPARKHVEQANSTNLSLSLEQKVPDLQTPNLSFIETKDSNPIDPDLVVDQYEISNFSEEHEKEELKKENEICDRYFGVLSKMKVLQLDTFCSVNIQWLSNYLTVSVLASPDIPQFFISSPSALHFIKTATPYFLNKEKQGVKILSNILEIHYGEAQFYRIVGFKLLELNLIETAILVFEKVLELRGEEPQSYRDLALSLAKRNTRKDVNLAVQNLLKVIQGRWDVRFDQIEVTCLMDLKLLFNRANLLGIPVTETIPQEIEHHLHSPMDLDLRIVVTWDTNLTDVELIVVEPNNEVCQCFHK